MLVMPTRREKPVEVQRSDKTLQWTDRWYLFLGTLIQTVNAFRAPQYTVATLPTAGKAGRVVFVSDETGGAVLAFDDGSNWKRVTDRATVS